jgi:hypothetical protein
MRHQRNGLDFWLGWFEARCSIQLSYGRVDSFPCNSNILRAARHVYFFTFSRCTEQFTGNRTQRISIPRCMEGGYHSGIRDMAREKKIPHAGFIGMPESAGQLNHPAVGLPVRTSHASHQTLGLSGTGCMA